MADPSKGLAPPPSRDAEAARLGPEAGGVARGRDLAAAAGGGSRRKARSADVSPHTTTNPTTATAAAADFAAPRTLAPEDQRQRPLYHHHRSRLSRERLFGMAPDEDTLHYENVNREGRSASVVRDDEGFIAYPSLVPPAVESLSAGTHINDAAHDYSQSYHRQSGVFEGRPKAISDPSNPEDIRGAGGPSDVDIVVTAPNGESSVATTAVAPSAVSPATKKTRSRDPEGVDQVTALRQGRKRSSTLPMRPKRRNSDVTLIQELRRTSTLQWDLLNYPAQEEEEEVGPLSHDVSQTPGLGAGAASGQQQQQQQQQPPPAAGQATRTHAPFWKKPSKQKTKTGSSHLPSLKFLNSQSFRRDGRLPISVKDTSHTGVLAKAVGAAVRRITPGEGGDDEHTSGTDADSDIYAAAQNKAEVSVAATEFEQVSRNLAHRKCPRLNVVIMVIGSRGDVQPFLKIGKVLKEKYGHRVRVATHPAFRDFIEKDAGLEFFSAGGDPAELMAFMVKNPGMIPSLATVRSGDIGRRRDAMAEMFDGFWRACVDATDDPNDIRNLKLVGDKEPFIADAIIANPPSYVHVHCAEALGIPLHVMFTFPYTPTQAFPHPLANIKKTNVDPGYTNFISYPLIDMMVWQGLGDLVNNFRVNTLDLDPISMIWAPGAIYRMHVPFTYLWSPGLIPKPDDWGPEIDIGGFVFLELASSFKPPASLQAFLAASDEPPIYIGFGSIVVDDADNFTEMIFEAVRMAGVRALVSKGWGGFGGKGDSVPDNIYMLENTPHDWLFPQVRACVIHGGAGTTAIALKCGLPIMVVPFFGDQYFWGSMLHKSKVGPKPVPYKSLTAERLAEGIEYLLGKEARSAAQTIAASIEKEGDGAENACKSFQRTIELEGHGSIRCSIFPDRVAVWQRKGSNIKLSALAAEALVEKRYMTYKNLRLLRHTEWNDFEGPGEPITAMFGSLARSFRDVISGPFSAAGQIISGGKKSKNDGKDGKAKKEVQTSSKVDAKQKQTPNGAPNGRVAPPGDSSRDVAEENSLDDEDDIIFGGNKGGTQGSSKAEEGSFEVVFSAVGKSVGKSAVALAMAPIDLIFALCQGFHNAPRLYGDDTVRRPAHVTGFKSGMKAAGNEFVFGVYDGFTGIVRLPIRFARNGGGIHGFIRGVGRGVMGFVLKDISAIIGPFGYALKGLAKQAQRSKQPTRYLRRGRIMQAQREVRALTAREWQLHQEKAVVGWESMHALYKAVQLGDKKRTKGSTKRDDLEANNDLVRTRSTAPRRGSNDSVFQHHHYHGVGSSARQSLEHLDAALENADLAAIALAAIRRGETLDSVIRNRHSCPKARRRRPCQLCGPPVRDQNLVCRNRLALKEIEDQSDEGGDGDEAKERTAAYAAAVAGMTEDKNKGKGSKIGEDVGEPSGSS